MNLKMTLTKDKHDVENLPTKELTWGEFIERLKKPVIRSEKDGEGFCPAIFEGGRKLKDKALSLALLVVEYDHNFTLDDLKVWAKWEHVIYSSHSHKRKTEKNPEAGERLRVVILLSEPIDPENYELLWLWAEKQSGHKIDRAPKSTAQMFYLPAIAEKDAPFYFFHNEGEFLKWRELGPVKEPKVSKRASKAPSSPLILEDNDLIEKAKNASNGALFSLLWNGDWEDSAYKSQSEADLALCNLLAFWTKKDPSRMNQLFKKSKLYREEKGKNYLDKTIQEAISGVRDGYSDHGEKKKLPSRSEKKGEKKSDSPFNAVFTQNKYSFRYNVVTGRLECSRDGSEFRALESRDFSTIFCLVRQYKGLDKTPENVLKNFLESEFGSAPCNPVKEYFLGLQWDGKLRLRELVKFLKPKDEESALKKIGRWMVGVVTCALEEAVHENCLVLTGKQGVGKSRWLNNLLLKTSLNKYLLVTRNLDPDNKDSQMALTEKILINLDELAALSRHEIESIKEIFSKPVVTYRRPYAHYMQDFSRRASFCGTTNNDRFLTDQTGNRRWQVIECHDSIDIENLDKLDYDQIWAEVMVMKNKGVRPWLNASEIEETNEENEHFEVKTMEEELIQKYCLSPERSNEEFKTTKKGVTATDIASFLTTKKDIQLNNFLVRGVGVALSKLGYSKTRIHNPSKWIVSLNNGSGV